MIRASVVYPVGESHGECGYCAGAKATSGVALERETSVSYGMHAEVLSVESYQALLDRGWRRSGKWLYKPVLSETCCQLQTIRLEVGAFVERGSQRRVRKRWHAYLKGGGEGDEEGEGGEGGDQAGDRGGVKEEPERKSVAGSDDGTDRSSVDMVDVEVEYTDGQEDEVEAEVEIEVEPKRPRLPQDEVFVDDDEFVVVEDVGAGHVTPNGKRQEGSEYKGKRQRSHLCLVSLAEAGGGGGAAEMSPSVGFTEKLRVDSVDPTYADGFDGVGMQELGDVKEVVTKALAAAVVAAKEAGEIPRDVSYPDVYLKRSNARLKKMHGSDLVFSSSIAFAIAGKAKSTEKTMEKTGETTALTPAAVATVLLKRAVAVLGGASGYSSASKMVSLRQVEGHLNVFCGVMGAMGAMESVVDAPGTSRDRAAKAAAPASKTLRSFRVVTVPSSHPDIPNVEFELFKKYQTIHHNDTDVSIKSFKRFLCDSPLVHVSREECPTAPECGYGSFHQQYWVDDRLIAVGVVDVLPKCLSSKYFFWDPSMAKLSLGTLASLLEIDWVKSQAALAPEFRHYYLGYYLHDCHRMRYKASFAPSELLNPLTYEWVPIASIADDLDAGRAPWNLRGDGRTGTEVACEGGACTDRDDVDDVKLGITYPESQRQAWKVMPFGALRQLGLPDADDLAESIRVWRRMVGPECADSIMYAV